MDQKQLIQTELTVSAGTVCKHSVFISTPNFHSAENDTNLFIESFTHLCPEMNPVAKFTNFTIFRYARAKITNFTDCTFFSCGDAKMQNLKF